MKVGIAVLIASYVLSQFYRAFLAVLTVDLDRDIGASPDDLALASGVWFLAFAAAQIPVGASLDRIGPKRTAGVLFALGAGGGAAVFAMASTPAHIVVAMALIGVGCAPVLMAAYFIFARIYPPAVFAMLAGAVIGIGSLGNIAGSAPLVAATEIYGWRNTMWALSATSVLIAVLILIAVKEPPKLDRSKEPRGSVLDVLRMRALWPIFAITLVGYAPSAGLRGLWAGPYAEEVFAAGPMQIGRMTLIMGLAMVAGNFIYGPLDRLFGTRKWVILGGNAIGAAALFVLWLYVDSGIWLATVLFAVIGMTGSSFPLIMAHARAFIPAHLTGRGITLVNLFGIGGVGVMQMVTGRLHRATSAGTEDVAAPYAAIFLTFGLVLTVGLVAFLFARDRTD